MHLDHSILRDLCKRANCNVKTTAGAATLCYDIELATGERLSLNTIKRLTGVLPYESKPRVTTLDIIARYLGFDSWLHYTATLFPRSSQFGTKHQHTNMARLPEGQRVRITWSPDRILCIRHINAGSYEVEESVNGKLRAGDLIQLVVIGVGFPFLALEVIRDGLSLGSYETHYDCKVTSLEIL